MKTALLNLTQTSLTAGLNYSQSPVIIVLGRLSQLAMVVPHNRNFFCKDVLLNRYISLMQVQLNQQHLWH